MPDSSPASSLDIDAFIIALTHDIRNELNGLALHVTDLTEQVAFDPANLDPNAGLRIQHQIQHSAARLKAFRDWLVPEPLQWQRVDLSQIIAFVEESCRERAISFAIQEETLPSMTKVDVALDWGQISEAIGLLLDDVAKMALRESIPSLMLSISSSAEAMVIFFEGNFIASERTSCSDCKSWGLEIPSLNEIWNEDGLNAKACRYRVRRLLEKQGGACEWMGEELHEVTASTPAPLHEAEPARMRISVRLSLYFSC